jgi:hypothetical protein
MTVRAPLLTQFLVFTEKSLQTNRDFQKCKVSKQEASISSGAVFHLVVVVLSVPTTRMKIIPCVVNNLLSGLTSKFPKEMSLIWYCPYL